MTLQQIIKQTETFTTDQKQQLGYYFLYSTLNEDKKNNLMQMFLNIKDIDFEKKIIADNEKSIELSNQSEKETPVLGVFKGMVEYMADDFDAPLDDLKEYMY